MAGSTDLDQRVQDFASGTTSTREAILEEVVGKICDRLLLLFELREPREESASFEQWLCRQFEYDHYYTFCIFHEDKQLESLVGYIDVIQGNMAGRPQAARMVNDRLRQAGHIGRFGIGWMFADIKRL